MFRFTSLDSLVPFARIRASMSTFDGRETAANAYLIRACTHYFQPKPDSMVIVAFRVERLQDISESDALAEGIRYESIITDVECYGGPPVEITKDCYYNGTEDDESLGHDSASEAFAVLWDGINAKRGFGWDANPWVVAVTFARSFPSCPGIPDSSSSEESNDEANV